MKTLTLKIRKLTFYFIQKIKFALFRRFINKSLLIGSGLEVGPGERPFANRNNAIFLEYFVDDYDALFPNAKKDNFISGKAEDIPVPDDSYDFIVSSHCLEHCVDPIKVLKEFRRVLKSSGTILLILPHCERTFDFGRPISTLESHIFDHESEVSKENYLEFEGKYFTVFDDFLRISTNWPRHTWIPSMTHADGTWNKEKILNNGIIHYHVWTQTEIIELLLYVGCKINLVMDVVPGRLDSFIVSATVEK